MTYKHKFNDIIYDTENEVFGQKSNAKVWKIYPKMKDSPIELPTLSENPTEEEFALLQEIELSNIEYMVKEYI